MLAIRPSKSMKISLHPFQENKISSKEKIRCACENETVFAFDLYSDERLIGFAMFNHFAPGAYFLWNFAIDKAYQNQGLGRACLVDLIAYLRDDLGMNTLTTTYTWGNSHAAHLYESLGFVETEVVEEPDCHEVNMILTF